MESRRAKFSNPDYTHIAVANLNQLCSNLQDEPDRPQAQGFPQTSGCTEDATGSVHGGIDALDLLEHFYLTGEFPVRIESEVNMSSPKPIEIASSDMKASEFLPTSGTGSESRAPVVELASFEPSSDDDAAMLSLSAAAHLLSLDQRTVLGLVTVGQVAAVKDSRGQLLIERQSLLKFSSRDAIKRNGSALTPSAEQPPSNHNEVIDQTASTVQTSGQSEPIDLAASISSQAVPVQSTAPQPQPVRINIHDLVSKLAEAQSQLESANYRIGFLEAELTSNEHKVKLLPDLKTQDLRLAALERENKELRLRLERLEQGPLAIWHRLWALIRGNEMQRHSRQQDRRPASAGPDQVYYQRSRKEFF